MSSVKILLVVATLAMSSAAADRLENTYLPPLGAQTSGGSNFLAPPPNSYLPAVPASSLEDDTVEVTSSEVLSGGRHSGVPSTRSFPITQSAQRTPVAILKLNSDNDGAGHYRFAYETENRISQEESGELKNAGTDRESSVVRGSYSYAAPDGLTYTVNYIADENGFRATGDHLPTPPPIPAAIRKSLEISSGSFAGSSFSAGQYLTPKSDHKHSSSGYRY